MNLQLEDQPELRAENSGAGADGSPSKGRTRVVILGASYTTGNMGVDALLSGTIASVLHAWPEAEVVVFDYGREPLWHEVPVGGRTVPVRMVNLRFSKRISLPNNIAWLLGLALLARLVPSRRLRARIVNGNSYLRELHEARWVCSLAGGDSFSDIYGLRRLFYVGLPQLLALVTGRPLVLLPQTIGPFNGRFARWMARRILKNASAVFSRDRAGFEQVRSLLGTRAGEQVRFSPDMAFALEPQAPTEGLPDWHAAARGREPVVGLNVSGLLYMGGYSKDNMFGLSVDYRALVRDVILRLTVVEKAHVMLVAHVTGKALGEGDEGACSAVYEELKHRCEGRLHWSGQIDSHREIKFLIGHCDFFIGSRMHACIAALSQGVPAIGLAYSRKFGGVFDTVGAGDMVIDLRQGDATTAVESVSAAFRCRQEISAGLTERANEARVLALGLFSRLPAPPSDKNSAETGGPVISGTTLFC